MATDAWKQDIKNGDFILNASKSSGVMGMGVIKDVDKQTRWEIVRDYRTQKLVPEDKATRLYALGQKVLVLPDEFVAAENPELFAIVVELRKKMGLDTNQGVKTLVDLRALLQSKL